MSPAIDAVTAALTRATDGLLYPSESDEPFTAFAWPAPPGQTARQAVELHAGGKGPVVEQSTNAFFSALDDSDDADRYQTLLNVLGRTLRDVSVFRVGTIRVEVYLVGRAASHWAGLRTLSVET